MPGLVFPEMVVDDSWLSLRTMPVAGNVDIVAAARSIDCDGDLAGARLSPMQSACASLLALQPAAGWSSPWWPILSVPDCNCSPRPTETDTQPATSVGPWRVSGVFLGYIVRTDY